MIGGYTSKTIIAAATASERGAWHLPRSRKGIRKVQHLGYRATILGPALLAPLLSRTHVLYLYNALVSTPSLLFFKCTGIVITPCRHRGQGSMSDSRAQDDAAARRRDIANGTWKRISHTHVVSNIKLVDRIPLDHPLPDQRPSPKAVTRSLVFSRC